MTDETNFKSTYLQDGEHGEEYGAKELNLIFSNAIELNIINGMEQKESDAKDF